jgi:hypothetical protein
MCQRRDEKQSDEGTPWGEQEELEQAMIQRTGARRSEQPDHPDAPKKYDFVEDDHIDFVVMETIKGDLDSDASDRCVRRSTTLLRMLRQGAPLL